MSKSWIQNIKDIAAAIVEGAVSIRTGKNDLAYDAWGRSKAITDFSLFSALWTLSVPNRVWMQYNNTGSGDVEQVAIDNALVKSVNGQLQVTGTSATDVALASKRHPRYQPNRGLLYSTAVNAPNPEYVGKRNWGLMSTENGIFFSLEGNGVDWTLSVIRRTTENGITADYAVDITSFLPAGFDISKGHVYDIQMEWRGVGDFFIFVDLVKIYTINLLGTLSTLSISNPALHVAYQCVDAGANDILLLAGCVDVTSEGGAKSNKIYTSETTGTTLLPAGTAGTALLAIRLPVFIDYNGNSVRYTRDMILTEMTTFCKDEAIRSFYMGRHTTATNLFALTGWNLADDSFYQWRTNADGALDTAFQADKAVMQNVYSARGELDAKESHKNPDPNHSDFYLTGGDIAVVVLQPEKALQGAGVTLELAEEV